MAINEVAGVQHSQQRIERKYDEKTGELRSVSIFKDVNGDGKEDLYKVTTFNKMDDGTMWESTVIDKDGDGYYDYKKDTDYNANGKKVQEKEYYPEDINKVKSRPHLEHEIHNRQMEVHKDGGFIFMMKLQ